MMATAPCLRSLAVVKRLMLPRSRRCGPIHPRADNSDESSTGQTNPWRRFGKGRGGVGLRETESRQILKPIMPTFRCAHVLLIEGDIANQSLAHRNHPRKRGEGMGAWLLELFRIQIGKRQVVSILATPSPALLPHQISAVLREFKNGYEKAQLRAMHKRFGSSSHLEAVR